MLGADAVCPGALQRRLRCRCDEPVTSFITVTRSRAAGIMPGTTHVASDGRTVIFTMSKDFAVNELVTVTLEPGSECPARAERSCLINTGSWSRPICPNPAPITARGDNPPNGSKTNAFDNLVGTKWVDLVVPNGTANYSWIQYLYPGSETHVVNQYAITSAVTTPSATPGTGIYMVWTSPPTSCCWTRKQTRHSAAGARRTPIPSPTSSLTADTVLEITRVSNPATATAVQLAELQFIEPSGTLLREVWMGIGRHSGLGFDGQAKLPQQPERQ